MKLLLLLKNLSNQIRIQTWLKILLLFLLLILVKNGYYKLMSPEKSDNKFISLLKPLKVSSRPFICRWIGFSKYHKFIKDNNNEFVFNKQDISDELINQINKEAMQLQTDESIRAVAFIYLAKGDLDKSIDLLEDFSTHSKPNSAIYNDLAANYLTRGCQNSSLSDLNTALSIIEKAIALSPLETSAHFNRALILENLSLTSVAKDAWQEYINLEKDTQWQQEANLHILNLNSNITNINDQWRQFKEKLNDIKTIDPTSLEIIIDRFNYKLVNYTFEELLINWTNNFDNRQLDLANNQLQSAKLIGEIFANQYHDNLIQDAVKQISTSINKANSDQDIAQMIKALQAYRDLSQSIRQFQIGGNINQLTDLSTVFHQQKNYAYETIVLFQIMQWERDEDKRNNIFIKLQDLCNRYNYNYLLGRSWRIIGSFTTRHMDLATALTYQNRALDYLSRCNAREDQLMVHFVISETLNLIGDKEDLKQHQSEVILNLNKLNNLDDKALVLAGIASQIDKLNLNKVASYYHNESIKLSEQTNNPVPITVALLRRSQWFFEQNKFDQAMNDFKAAKDRIPAMDNFVKKLFQEEMDLMEGKFNLQTNPSMAIDYFSKAIESYQRYEDNYKLASLYKYLAIAYHKSGNDKQAELYFTKGITEFERERGAISTENQRIVFYEDLREIYDGMISLQIAKGNEDIAFNYSERVRARTLLDIIKGFGILKTESTAPKIALSNVGVPKKLNEIQTQLSPDTTILEYAVISEHIYVWVIKHQQTTLLDLKIDEKHLLEMIDSFQSYLSQNKKLPEIDLLAESIYDIIFKPLLPLLSQKKDLIIVSDKYLQSVPFAVLKNSLTHHYLIEDFNIINAPSSTIYLHCFLKDQQLVKQDDLSIFIIGNPSFNKSDFPELADLPMAEEESKQIKNLYESDEKHPSFGLVTKEKATKRNFLSAVDKFSAIHFSGHAIVDDDFPFYSQLVLAPKGQEKPYQYVLHSYELYHLDFLKTRLIVLAACRTGSGQQHDGEGTLSLARDFLARGVPAVIASKWEVEDEATADLFIKFHKSRLANENLPQALRTAQLAMLHSDNPAYRSPAVWGAFILFGGTTFTKPAIVR